MISKEDMRWQGPSTEGLGRDNGYAYIRHHFEFYVENGGEFSSKTMRCYEAGRGEGHASGVESPFELFTGSK